eukprot:scaffold365344_cov24-Attheya_sp.AAC.1
MVHPVNMKKIWCTFLAIGSMQHAHFCKKRTINIKGEESEKNYEKKTWHESKDNFADDQISLLLLA